MKFKLNEIFLFKIYTIRMQKTTHIHTHKKHTGKQNSLIIWFVFFYLVLDCC